MNTECPSQFQDQRISHGMVLETRPVENIVQVLEDGGHSLRKDIGSLEKDELKNTENLSFQGLSPNPPRDPNRWNNSWPLVGRSSLSDEEVVLLKYYSHHVAPWVSLHPHPTILEPPVLTLHPSHYTVRRLRPQPTIPPSGDPTSHGLTLRARRDPASLSSLLRSPTKHGEAPWRRPSSPSGHVQSAGREISILHFETHN